MLLRWRSAPLARWARDGARPGFPVQVPVREFLVRGILFLVPIALIVVLVREIVRLVAGAMKPVAKLAPADDVLGIAVVEILAITAIALVCFLAGLFAGTRIGGMLGEKLERLVLRRIPGFTLIKSMSQGLVGDRDTSDVKVALAWIENRGCSRS